MTRITCQPIRHGILITSSALSSDFLRSSGRNVQTRTRTDSLPGVWRGINLPRCSGSGGKTSRDPCLSFFSRSCISHTSFYQCNSLFLSLALSLISLSLSPLLPIYFIVSLPIPSSFFFLLSSAYNGSSNFIYSVGF